MLVLIGVATDKVFCWTYEAGVAAALALLGLLPRRLYRASVYDGRGSIDTPKGAGVVAEKMGAFTH